MSNLRWDDARRLEAWAGETRVNLIRAAASSASTPITCSMSSSLPTTRPFATPITLK